jgi:hypothetical protein
VGAAALGEGPLPAGAAVHLTVDSFRTESRDRSVW